MFLKDYYPKLNKKYFNVKFDGISFNSKYVKKKNIFFALKGNTFDGNKFIKEAISKGSRIIISEIYKEGFKENILYLKNKNPRRLLAEFATKLNKKKPNNLIAVTGTNGKSSIANFYTDLTAGKYSLHTEGLFFKGDWATSTFYRLNDLVTVY